MGLGDNMSEKKLQRSRRDRMLSGVLGGFAQFFGIDSSLLRVIFVVATLFSLGVPGVLAYLLAWAIIPEER